MASRTLFLTGILAFLLSAAIRLPASIIVPRLMPASVSYSAADGALWNGTLKKMSLQGWRLGDAAISLSPWSLLTGAPAADIRLSGGEAQGEFNWRHEKGNRLSDLDMVLDIKARLGERSLGGALKLTGGTFTFALDGRCTKGAADVRTNVLEQALGQGGPMLTGELICRDGRMQITLAGAAQNLTVTVDGNIGVNDGQGLRLSLTPGVGADIPEDIRRAFTLSGFSREADGSMTAQLELDIFL